MKRFIIATLCVGFITTTKAQKTDIPYPLYSSFFTKSDYYKRDVITTPLMQISLISSYNSLARDKEVNSIYNIMGRPLRINLNDTLIIRNSDIKYKSGKQRFHDNYSKMDFFESLAYNEKTAELLNGLYKVYLDKFKGESYYIGYFYNGDPYNIGGDNIFEYFEKSAIKKKRFFTHSIPNISLLIAGEYLYNSQSVVEDYTPINDRSFRREIKSWPDEQLLLADTVNTKGRKIWVVGVQHIYLNNLDGSTEQKIYKSHVFRNGKLEIVNQYKHGASSIEKTTTYLQDKRFRTQITCLDYYGRVMYSKSLADFDNKNCNTFLIDKYYLPAGHQVCFISDGTEYEYNGSTQRDSDLDFDQILTYKRGILYKQKIENINKSENFQQDLINKLYGRNIACKKVEIYDFEKQLLIQEYYTTPEKSLFLTIHTSYSRCLTHPLYDSFPCKDKSPENNIGFTASFTFYNSEIQPIFKGSYNQDFIGDFNDYLMTLKL
jgi:hypothetical protein